MRSRWTAPLSALGLAAAPATAQAALPTVLTQMKPAFEVRPSAISYTGDGTGIIGGPDGTSPWRHPGHLHWTRYNHREGYARGVVWLDDCRPSCAEGTFHPRRVKVHVFRARHGRFHRLTLTFRYHGRRYVDRRGIRHFPRSSYSPGYWAYYIIGSRPG